MAGIREIPLMRQFLATYRNKRVRLFRRQIINKTVQDIHSGRVLQMVAGIVGQSDVYGFVKRSMPIYGVGDKVVGWTASKGPACVVEIEFKAANTPVSEEQENWRNFCKEWGVPHLELRAARGEEPNDTIARWTRLLDQLVDGL